MIFKKKTKLAIIFIIFLTLFFFLSKTIGNNDYPIAQKIKSFVPKTIKETLKNSVFIFSIINNKNNEQDADIKKLKQSVKILEAKVFEIENDSSLILISDKKIISDKGDNFNLKIYKLPLPPHEEWGSKPVAYLETDGDKIYFSSGDGRFFYIENNSDFLKKKVKYYEIDTNIKKYIFNEDFFEPSTLSIKDIFIKDKKIFFTYGHLEGECLTLQVAYSDINAEYLEFKDFFSKKECNKEYDFINAQHIGGRLVNFSNGRLLLSTGDMGYENLSNDKNSIFGKILSINDNNNHDIISIGHRNPQGLFYNKNKNIILNTEHGPTGGDEVNVNDLKGDLKHYGWPFASYGIDDYIKHKDSHSKYGYIEPILNFTPSIGISQIIKTPKDFFNEQKDNRYLVTSLGWNDQIAEGDNSIHIIGLNDTNNIIYKDRLKIFERIRDIIYVKNLNSFLLSLESVPAIGILTKE